MKVKLGEICEIVSGVSYKPTDASDVPSEDKVALLRANNIQNGKVVLDDLVYVNKTRTTPKHYLRTGDILICASNGSKALVGKAALIRDLPFPAVFGAFCRVARPTIELPEYVNCFFQSPLYRRAISSTVEGSNINNLRTSQLESLSVSLPSLEEQRKIAEVLDRVTDLLAKRQEQLTQLDTLVKARFVEMFGDPLTRPLHSLASVKDVGEVLTGSTPSMSNADYYCSQDIPFIKPGDIAEDSVSLLSHSEAFVSEHARSAIRLFPKDSVLVTCIGTIGKIGISVQESCCNQQINVVIPNNKINTRFLAYVLLLMKQKLADMANAPVVPILNKTNFSKLSIPVPPLSLQEDFTSFVERVEGVRGKVTEGIRELETLKSALMQDYFG